MRWPALVLTAGLGTRMRPLSYDRAKPAMPVAGPALVGRILAWLASHGVSEAVLNLHYKPETITAVVGEGAAFGVRVRYSWENPVLGSAGGPRHALPLLDSPKFFIVNGDTLCDVNLTALKDHHVASGARVTMALVPQKDPAHYGGVNLAANGAVTDFPRRRMPSDYHFVGIQAADADAFACLPDDQPWETVGALYPQMIAQAGGSVRGFVTGADFHDIGTPADYLSTTLSLGAREGRALPLVGARCELAPSAVLRESILWDDVVVGANVTLEQCIVGDGVRLPAGAAFKRAAIVRAAGHAPCEGEELVGALLVRRF